jgi:hypothetical protein
MLTDTYIVRRNNRSAVTMIGCFGSGIRAQHAPHTQQARTQHTHKVPEKFSARGGSRGRGRTAPCGLPVMVTRHRDRGLPMTVGVIKRV